MSSQLAVLPFEIVEFIAGRAEPADLLSLRLVCRLLRAKSIQCFGRTFFSVVRSDLSITSLEKLKSISEHEQLKHHVQGLLIKGYNGLGQGFRWTRSPSGHLIAPMQCVEALRTILLNDLIHCRSFHVYREYEPENDYEVDCLAPSDAVAIIFMMVAETALPIKSFNVDFTEFSKPKKLDMKRLHIPEFPGSQRSRFISGWGHLEELILEYTMSVESLSLTTGLVLSAPYLQKLKLGPGFESHDDESSDSFFERLSAAEGLPALRELSISGVQTTGPILARFVFRFGPSLCTLSFWHVMITSHDTWAAFFRAMRSNFPLLEHISVEHLKELQLPKTRIIFPLLDKDNGVPDTGGRKFDLKYKSLRRQQMVIGAKYSGPGVDMALEVLARSAYGMV